jgi:hypothetical protein
MKNLIKAFVAELILEEISGDKSLSTNLARLAKTDQKWRGVYQKWINKQGGWTKDKHEELVSSFSKKYNRDPDDLFGTHSVTSEIKKIFYSMDDESFGKLSEVDWDNFWLCVQHADDDIQLQRDFLEVLQKFGKNQDTNIKYLYDRISCNTSGTQKYGTQDICGDS